MTTSISIEKAQESLRELIHGLSPGDELIIMENQQAVAALVAKEIKPPRPAPGLGKGSILYMAADFDAPLEEMKEYME